MAIQNEQPWKLNCFEPDILMALYRRSLEMLGLSYSGLKTPPAVPPDPRLSWFPEAALLLLPPESHAVDQQFPAPFAFSASWKGNFG